MYNGPGLRYYHSEDQRHPTGVAVSALIQLILLFVYITISGAGIWPPGTPQFPSLSICHQGDAQMFSHLDYQSPAGKLNNEVDLLKNLVPVMCIYDPFMAG